MEAHIKGHANEMPDDEGNDAESTTTPDTNKLNMEEASSMEVSSIDMEIASSTTSMRSSMASSMSSALSTSSSMSSSSSPPINPSVAVAVAATSVAHTPRASSSSETNSDGDEVNYYNLYSRFEQSMADNGYNHQTGVNPALLAAVSIVASANEEHNQRNNTLPHSSVSMVPPAPSAQPISNALLAAVNQQDALLDHSFIYEPLAIMRQQGYFTPAPKVEEFRYDPLQSISIEKSKKHEYVKESLNDLFITGNTKSTGLAKTDRQRGHN